jgi:hypothetical protein
LDTNPSGIEDIKDPNAAMAQLMLNSMERAWRFGGSQE